MNKEQYFKKSEEIGLVNRCPILNYCGRRANTIILFSRYDNYDFFLTNIQKLINAGEIPEDFENNCIQEQGESTYILRGKESTYFSDACPEVNLFNNGNALIPEIACTEGSIDNYRNFEERKVIKCGHFSECPEYNKYLFDKKSIKKKRKTIPYKTKAVLQKEINSKCPFCVNSEVGHFQVHHLDENPENNKLDNLLMLCPMCHSKITKGDIEPGSVRRMKNKISEV